VHHRPDRIAGFYDILEDLVNDVLLENAKVSITEEILLKRFQFEATLARHVADSEHAKIRKAGLGANRSEFRIVNGDFVARELILPRLNFWKCEIESSLCVIVGVTRFRSHGVIVRGASMTNKHDIVRILCVVD
jgi:hypothetical protein